MKKLLLVVFCFILSACNKAIEPAPFGLNWDMPESDIDKILTEESKKEIKKDYTLYSKVKVPAGEIDGGLYLLYFKENKLEKISVSYSESFRDVHKVEKIFDYYKAALEQKYGKGKKVEPSVDEKKLCAEINYCKKEIISYSASGVDIKLTFTVNSDTPSYFVFVTFTKQ